MAMCDTQLFDDDDSSDSDSSVYDSSDDDSSDDDSSDDEFFEDKWFHGSKPTKQVKKLLRENGDFLVHTSKDRSTKATVFLLSVFWEQLRNFQILHDKNGWSVEGNYSDSIPNLINNLKGKYVSKKSQIILKTPIKEEWKLKREDISLKDKIGKGNFGTVYIATYLPLKMDVAVKKSERSMSKEETEKFFREGVTLGKLSHPNIVGLIGIVVQEQPMIVMEYVAGGDLLKHLRDKGEKISIKSLIKMCKDASNGMAYLEKKGVLHRDLAARNCLVDKSMVKITDFGMSREEGVYMSVSQQIPFRWTAPESLKKKVYTSRSDVWSFGILMWEIFSRGQKPYPDINTNEEVVYQVDRGYTMNAPEGTPDACSNLMKNCWEYNPDDRDKFDVIHKQLKKIHENC